jgi:hypothetical protein
VFRRLFWLLMGAGFGFGASFWLMRFVRETVARYSPQRVSRDLTDSVRSFRQDLRAAVTEGRDAMHEREAELRASLGPARSGGG